MLVEKLYEALPDRPGRAKNANWNFLGHESLVLILTSAFLEPERNRISKRRAEEGTVRR
jgi:hypothetical protein